MTATAAPLDGPYYADRNMIELLRSAGLAVRYTRAAGSYLYHEGPDGAEIPVLDLACGFGSLMFGHNHPGLIARAKQLLDEGIPVHTQFTGLTRALDLANQFNEMARGQTGTDEPWFGLFGSTGAEAVEIAIKHAEFDRGARAAALKAELAANVAAAREAVAAGAAVAPHALAVLGLNKGETHAESVDRLAAEAGRRNDAAAEVAPLVLAFEGAFHGKLISTSQLTYNEMYRAPFRSLAMQARFVPPDRPELAAKIVEQEQSTVYDLVVRGGAVEVERRAFPRFAAFIVEPIMGEAGIRPMTEELAAMAREVADATGAPLIADEVQSGMGRSGTFLAGAQIGLRPDYVILAKSLGGGIVKTGAVFVREGRFHGDFDYVQSSTFGKDGLSSLVAVEVMRMLAADDDKAMKVAAERGAKALAMMESVKADFPDIVKDARGKGLMLGIELFDQGESSSPVIRDWVDSHLYGFIICGFLLREHNIRIFTTASSSNTLRFEPSIYITDEEIDLFEAGLRDLCTALREADDARISAKLS
ncbi:aspartate aminotransferase family protein [Actinokineospora pegani]|uniref:aspartate aminotransferase family protein n=1 Tax=Actinokineospora pegani TaxID=2654637 RepID=UPI0018D46C32|nr:aminotransferase class III-fold pyridoxal phosphate-dependent enzyme [Actinokineospora pegani]